MPGSRVRVPPLPPLCKIATNMRPRSVLPRDPSRPACRLPWIHLKLRRLRLLTQGMHRGAHGANQPRSIAELAGCDGDGSREEGGKSPSDSLIQLGTHADASPEYEAAPNDGQDGTPARLAGLSVIRSDGYRAAGFDCCNRDASVELEHGRVRVKDSLGEGRECVHVGQAED